MKRQMTSLVLLAQLLLAPITGFAQDKPINLQDLALPSEVTNINKSAGSVYYSAVVKDKVLIPVHIWGSVQKPGLHFIPTGTNLVEALSLAGGPTLHANLEKVNLTRDKKGKIKGENFNLKSGGNSDAFATKLISKDTIFVEKSTFREDRNFYTSLVGVVATVLSSVLLIQKINED